jgi:hypothetical protein
MKKIIEETQRPVIDHALNVSFFDELKMAVRTNPQDAVTPDLFYKIITYRAKFIEQELRLNYLKQVSIGSPNIAEVWKDIETAVKLKKYAYTNFYRNLKKLEDRAQVELDTELYNRFIAHIKKMQI